jgi:hypothetical protein
MSTILKALRRLEEEKRSQQPASLEEDVLLAAESARRSPRPWVLSLGIATGAALAVVLLLGALVYTLPIFPPAATSPLSTQPVPGRFSVSGVPAGQAPAAPAAARESRPPVAAAPQPPALFRPASIETVAVEPSPAEPRAPLAESAGGPAEVAPAAAPVSQARPQSVAAVRPPPPVAAAPDVPLQPADEPVPIDVAAVEPAAPPVVPAAAKPSRAVPEAEVEVLERRHMPSLRVTRTIWHPNPDRRVAVVQLLGRPPQKLGEGDVVAGFTVVEIGLADVELERDGVILQRRVGAK